MNPIELRDHALWATKVLRPERAGSLRREDARNLLRRTMTAYVAKYDLRFHAWSVAPSRIHVVVAIPTDLALTKLLGELFGYYTRRFNARYGRGGPVFRTKFLRRVLIGPLAITDAIRRVHAVPRAEGIKPEAGDEPWSSHDCYEYGGRSDGVVTLYAPTVVAVRRMPMLEEEAAPMLD